MQLNNQHVFSAIALATIATLASCVFAGAMDDRVLWRFELATPFSGQEVSVGPDGTIYGSDNLNLYALNPDGSVKWSKSGVGGGTPIDFLADGTVVVALGVTVYALDPADGSIIWTFSYDGNGLHEQIEVGPSVGPDGNIYAVSSVDGEGAGLGAFSLTPAGNLRWADEGEPLLDSINAGTGGRVFFTDDRMIFPFVYSAGSPIIFGYDFDGNQTLLVDFTCTGAPRTDPLNRLLIAGLCGVEALEQDGNQSFWSVGFGPVNFAPAIGADATAYSGNWLGVVAAINPDGTIQWEVDGDDPERIMAVRQDVGRLVYCGGGFGVPNYVRGLNTEDGSFAWSIELLTINGSRELQWTDIAATSLDGSTVYFATRFTSNAVPGAIYAVRIDDEASGTTGDMNGDGVVNQSDLGILLSAFGLNANADLDGDGDTDQADLGILLANFEVRSR